MYGSFFWASMGIGFKVALITFNHWSGQSTVLAIAVWAIHDVQSSNQVLAYHSLPLDASWVSLSPCYWKALDCMRSETMACPQDKKPVSRNAAEMAANAFVTDFAAPPLQLPPKPGKPSLAALAQVKL
jgi:hypothetical protein